MSKRKRIKKVIRSIIRVRLVKRIRFILIKRPSLAKIKMRIRAFLCSTILIINIVFTVFPAYAASDDINNNPIPIFFVIRRDPALEKSISRHSMTENVFNDAVIGENILIEKGLRHTVEVEKTVKTETKKLQSGKQRNNKKKFNRKIHTLSDLPKRRGDIITDKTFQSLVSFDSNIHQQKLRQKLAHAQTEQLESKERPKKLKIKIFIEKFTFLL